MLDGLPGSGLGLRSSPIEPPAPLVLLSTVPLWVVVVVLVISAELRPLVAGPHRHALLIVARQCVSCRARVGSEGQPVVALQKSIGSQSKLFCRRALVLSLNAAGIRSAEGHWFSV